MKDALVVDDKEENLHYLEAVLSSAGWNVRTARHGAEALALARQSRPDLVVSDLLMPVMDGYTLLRHWKADPVLRRSPFVVYTATYTEPEDEELALNLGADAFMLKPLEPVELLERIASVLASSEPARPEGTVEEDEDLALAYSETLIRKLEEKSLQLSEANRALEADIEARRTTERALEERVKELRALHEVARLVSDDDLPDDELLSRAVALIPPAMVHPDAAVARISYGNLESTTPGFERTPWLLETSFSTSDGVEGWVQLSYLWEYPLLDNGPFLDEERALIGSLAEMIRIAMERRQASERLKDQARLLRIAGELAELGGWALELPDGPLVWSDETCAIHDRPPGYRPTLEEALDYYHPADRPLIEADVEACVRDGAGFEREYRIRTAEGRWTWVYSVGEAVRDASGRIVRIHGAFQDISGRKAAEGRLREQAELLEKAQDAIVVRDMEHMILYWNRSAERLYGWSRDEVNGRSIVDLLYSDRAMFDEATKGVLSTGEWSGELLHRTRDGRQLVVEGRWTLVRDEEGRPAQILGINTDVTRRKELEVQMARVQRIESIGNLAGGIAHDLNNILAPILMAVGLLKLETDDPDSRELLESIESSARRGADMVGQILSFTRGTGRRREPIDLRRSLRDMKRLVGDTFPRSIRTEFELEEGLWSVNADQTQIHQVLLNLCVNARDAMPDGGTLRIAATNVEVDDHYAGMHGEARAGRYVRLDVVDTGHGIPEAILNRVWEPFFTTKEASGGTGLGLATTLGIVRAHEGFTTVYSTPGAGTRFRVYLPAASDEPGSEFPNREVDFTELRGAGELILVVDDEASIRQITQQTLEAAGYRALVAGDGAEAVAVFVENRSEIALVITDLMMPVMGGAAAAEALRRIKPSLRIIRVSGLTDEYTQGSSPDLGEILEKPFTATTLLEAVRRALDS